MKQQRWETHKREQEKRRSEKRKSLKKEDAGAQKRQNSYEARCLFNVLRPRLAKAAGAKPSGKMQNEKAHKAVARAILEAKMPKTLHARSTFGSSEVEKV